MKIKVLMLLFFSNIIHSQINTSVVEIARPNPSVANLMNLVDIPVNTHTGVPNIDIPLINIPTTSKNVNVNIGLSYHPAGIAFTNRASDVGTGWNLMAGGVISRTVTYLPDEYLYNLYQSLNWNVNQIVFDDIYSYNFHGYSGKFKIVYNATNNSFSVEKLDVNNLKISCEIISGTQKVNSFTIHDDNGLKYIFNIKDRNNKSYVDSGQRYYIGQQSSITVPTELNNLTYNYFSSHHLTEVYDNNNIKLVNYTYSTHVKPGLVSGGLHDEVTNKMSNIESLNFGTISFDYSYTTLLENTLNDPFVLNNIVLKNEKNEIINKFNLNYYELDVKEVRRHLYKIEKIDTVNQQTEDHEFEYQTEIINTSPFYCNSDFHYGIDKFGYLNLTGNPFFPGEFDEYVTDGLFYEDFEERTSKDACLYGVLKTIKFPTGGKTAFEFESNTFRYAPSPYDLSQNFMHQYDIENTDNHIYTEIFNLNYNTNHGNQFPLVISGTEPVKVFIKVSPVAYYSQLNDPIDEPLYASFRLLGNGIDQILQRTTPTCLGDFMILDPGNYTIIVNSLEYSTGQIVITKKELTTQPIKEWVYGGGLRIKKISHFNSHTDTTPQRNINYEYNMFDDSNLTSGELYDGFFRSFATNKATNAQISYKNVKIFDTQNNGYTKHTYEGYTESSYFTNSAYLDYFQNYFGYKNGVLKKVEVFNNDSVILKETENQYEFTEYGYGMYISSILDYNYGSFQAKPCWSKLIYTTTKDYFYNGGTTNIVDTSESFTYNPNNLKTSSSTISNTLGETTTTNYYYHTGNSTHSQNRISEIERVETYRNGQLLSTSKINYANNWGTNVSFLPQTIQSSKGTNALETKVKYNKYDAFSNPLEVQQENGTKISYIWGYNNTQPVAKLENIAYDAIPSSLITAIQSATDAPNATETSILTALNALRTSTDTNMQKAMITTYTYKPLIGISTVTDPKTDKITYHYDSFNRLEFVKDKNGNILSENEYHYRTQN